MVQCTFEYVCQNTHQILNGWCIASLDFQKPFDESVSFLHSVSLSEIDFFILTDIGWVLVYSVSVLAWRSACGCIVSRSFSLAGVFSCEEHLFESDFGWISSCLALSLLGVFILINIAITMLNQLCSIVLMSIRSQSKVLTYLLFSHYELCIYAVHFWLPLYIMRCTLDSFKTILK